jgi:phosphoglycolate phosphatase-like HAD superfamily hydrolase
MAFGTLTKAVAVLSAAAVSVEGFLGGSSKMTSSLMHKSSLASTTSSADTGATEAVRGIIFDIDGTLADSWNLGFQATLTVLTDYHNENNEETHTAETYPLTSEEYHFGCRYTTPERLARHVGLDPEHPSFESVGEDLGGKFDDYYVQLVDTKTAGFYDGIGDLLVKLNSDDGSGVQLGALTNACVEYAHAVLKTNCPQYSSDNPSTATDENDDNSIYQRFSSIHGANSVPRPKPFGDGILQCCEEMNLLPSQVIYVGDAPTDARAAVDAKCRAAIGVLWGSNDEECLKQEEGFKVLCSDVEELGTAIEQYL